MTSIIIRVKNERENLDKLFKILKNQTYQEFEIIVVNNNSTDGSEKVAFDYFPKDRVQIVRISSFSYPRACNLGAEKSKGKYLAYLSAHSFPVSNTWLEDGLSNFKDEKAAGVSCPIPSVNSTNAEKVLYGINNKIRVSKGVGLVNTNSIIRRDLWKKHKFDENLKTAEDYEWAIYWKSKGYSIVNDLKFSVNHSHNLGVSGVITQELKRRKVTNKINKQFNTTKYQSFFHFIFNT